MHYLAETGPFIGLGGLADFSFTGSGVKLAGVLKAGGDTRAGIFELFLEAGC